MDPFNFLFDNGDLRKITVHGKEIIQRIYYAVRDAQWLNVPYKPQNHKTWNEDAKKVCSYDLHFKNNFVDFITHVVISVINDTIVIETNGEARSNFRKNRVGLCIHLPSSLKGTACKITHTNGKVTYSALPDLVSPHQPFKNISEIALISNGVSTVIAVEGDVFEMEDQRNWSDASYKIYSTPLDLPFPVEVKRGNTFYQKITISSTDTQRVTSKDTDKTTIDEPLPCPEIGIFDLNNLNALDNTNQLFSFVRIDFRLFEDSWKRDVQTVIMKTTDMGFTMYCMLYLSANYASEITDFLYFIKHENLKEKIHSIALLSCERFVLSDMVLTETCTTLRASFPAIRIGGGTDANFAQLNRNRPNTDLPDFLFYSIQPQEHSSDQLSLIENIMGQYDTVVTSKSFSKGKEIDISALSFYRRFNANKDFIANKNSMTDYEHKGTNFEAAWFIGAMCQLVKAGIRTATLVCSIEKESPLLNLFSHMAVLRPEFFYSEESFSPEEYSFISWRSKNKKHSIFANLKAKRLNFAHRDTEITLRPYEILYKESELPIYGAS